MTLLDNLQKIISTTSDNKLKQKCILINESISNKKTSELRIEFKNVLNESSDYEAKKMLNKIQFADLKDKLFRSLTESDEEVEDTLHESYKKLVNLSKTNTVLNEKLTAIKKNFKKEILAIEFLRVLNENSHLLDENLYTSVMDSIETYMATSFTSKDILDLTNIVSNKIVEARMISRIIEEELNGVEETEVKINESFVKAPFISAVYSERPNHLIIFDGKTYFQLNENVISVLNQTEILALPNSWRMFTKILSSDNISVNENKIVYNVQNALYPTTVEFHLSGEVVINGKVLENNNVKGYLASQSLNGVNDTDAINAQEIANHKNSLVKLDFVNRITCKLNENVNLTVFNLDSSKTIVRNSKTSSTVYSNVNESVLLDVVNTFYGIKLNEKVSTSLLNSSVITEDLFESISLKNLDKNTLKVEKVIAPVKFIGNNPEVLIGSYQYRILKDSVKVFESTNSSKLNDILSQDNVQVTNEGIVYTIDKNKFLNKVTINDKGIFVNKQLITLSNLKETLNEGNWSISEDIENIKIIFNSVDDIVEVDNAWKISVNESSNYFWNVFKIADNYFVDKIDTVRNSRITKVIQSNELLESIKGIFNVNIDESLNESLKITSKVTSKLPTFEATDFKKTLLSGKLGLTESVKRFKKKKWFNTPEVYYLASSIEEGKNDELAIFESWLDVLKHFEFDNDVKNELKHYSDIKENYKKELYILETINNVKKGPQSNFFEEWCMQISEALNNDSTVEEMIKINNKWEMHNSIKNLNAYLNKFRSTSALNIKSLNESIEVLDVHSPICFSAEDPNISYFYAKPNFFKYDKVSGEISQLKEDDLAQLSKEWMELCFAMGSEAVVISDEAIGMYLDNNKIVIDLKSNKVSVNDQEVYSPEETEMTDTDTVATDDSAIIDPTMSTDDSMDQFNTETEDSEEDDTLAESLMKTGAFNYEQLHQLNTICKIYEGRNSVIKVDFAKLFKNRMNSTMEVVLFKTSKGLYLNGLDSYNRTNLFESVTANYATNLIKNWFGIDISESVISFLNREHKMINSINESKNEFSSKIIKYKDQLRKIEEVQSQNVLMKDSTELNEAKTLLKAEISRINSEMQSLDIKLNGIFENRVYKIGDRIKVKVSEKLGVITSIDETAGKFNVIVEGKSQSLKFSEFDDIDSDIEIINQNVNEALDTSLEAGFPSVGATAILVSDVNNIPSGTEVLINPIQFTSSGDDDIIEYVVNGEKFTTDKKNIKYVDPAAKKALENS